MTVILHRLLRGVTTALNGILFIDEAYSLVGENNDSYGNEAVATLIKRIEDDRDKLIVILAGYTDKIKKYSVKKSRGKHTKYTELK